MKNQHKYSRTAGFIFTLLIISYTWLMLANGWVNSSSGFFWNCFIVFIIGCIGIAVMLYLWKMENRQLKK